MQILASEFSKNFLGVIPPDPHSGRGDPSRTQHPARPLAGRGASATVLGPKSLAPPSTFQPWLRPWIRTVLAIVQSLLIRYRTSWSVSIRVSVQKYIRIPFLIHAAHTTKYVIIVPICINCGCYSYIDIKVEVLEFSIDRQTDETTNQ